MITIKQSRGPTYVFDGELLAEETFETQGRPPMLITMQIWETDGGAYIASSSAVPVGGGRPDSRAIVVEPGDWRKDADAPDNLSEMRIEVMDFFAWSDRARGMVKRDLPGWDFTVRVA